VVDDEETQEGGLSLALIDSTTPVQSDTESDIGSEDATQPPPSPQQPSPRSYDAHFLPYDPGERIPISRYNAKDQDDVRRGYILKSPCQPCEHDFPIRKIKKKNRHFTPVWFYKYPWLEYSIAKDAAFCFVCYLFKARSQHLLYICIELQC
jgi:hypothetical protein